MTSKDYLFSICIPTYNRPELLDIVKIYLTLDDSRFCVHITDNCSNDGTFEQLRLLAESNSKIILHRNEINLGFRENYIKCLADAPAEYVMFTIDKDQVDIGHLPEFLDILQKKQPAFGYVPYGKDTYEFEHTYIHTYIHGVDAICNCGFLNRHPSGYFYRKNLFMKEISLNMYQNLHASFAFPFDMAMGGLGATNDAMVIDIPLVALALKKLPSKTLSYNEDNIYFGFKMRLVSFCHYIERLSLTNLSSHEKSAIAKYELRKLLAEVTLHLRSYYSDSQLTNYYNLRQRRIGYFEMLNNMTLAMKTYVKVMIASGIPHSNWYLFMYFNRRAISIARTLIKQFLKSLKS